MVTRVGDLIPLEDARARSLVAGRSNPIARSLAGACRVLYELIAGQSAVAGEEAVAGTNPQGGIGVDLSGPPWGPALLHPIGVWAGLADDADVIQPSPVLNVVGLPSTGGLGVATTGPWRIKNRPHDAIDGVVAPYSRGLVTLRAHKANATNGTVVVRARNISLGEDMAAASTSISVTSTSETTFNLGTSFFVPLRSGWNDIQFEFFTSSSGASIIIDSLCVYQGAKLNH